MHDTLKVDLCRIFTRRSEATPSHKILLRLGLSLIFRSWQAILTLNSIAVSETIQHLRFSLKNHKKWIVETMMRALLRQNGKVFSEYFLTIM